MLHEETGQKKGSNELGKDDLEDKFLGTMNRDLYLHFVGELIEIFVSVILVDQWHVSPTLLSRSRIFKKLCESEGRALILDLFCLVEQDPV